VLQTLMSGELIQQRRIRRCVDGKFWLHDDSFRNSLWHQTDCGSDIVVETNKHRYCRRVFSLLGRDVLQDNDSIL